MPITTRYCTLRAAVGAAALTAWLRHDDRGEGVISAAIAVLVMAFLGVAMWVGLRQIWENTEQNTADQVEQIGQ